MARNLSRSCAPHKSTETKKTYIHISCNSAGAGNRCVTKCFQNRNEIDRLYSDDHSKPVKIFRLYD